jgi:hypothetical protein
VPPLKAALIFRKIGPESFKIILPSWACSSAGRAPALQAGGRRFDPGHVHQFPLCKKRVFQVDWF